MVNANFPLSLTLGKQRPKLGGEGVSDFVLVLLYNEFFAELEPFFNSS